MVAKGEDLLAAMPAAGRGRQFPAALRGPLSRDRRTSAGPDTSKNALWFLVVVIGKINAPPRASDELAAPRA